MGKLGWVGSLIGGAFNAFRKATNAVPDAAKEPGTLSKVWGGVKKYGAIAVGLVGLEHLANGGKLTSNLGTSLGMGAKDKVDSTLKHAADTTAGAGLREKFSGFFTFLHEFGNILKMLGVGGGIPETLMKFGSKGLDRETTIRDQGDTGNLLTWGNGLALGAAGFGGVAGYKLLKGKFGGGGGGNTPGDKPGNGTPAKPLTSVPLKAVQYPNGLDMELPGAAAGSTAAKEVKPSMFSKVGDFFKGLKDAPIVSKAGDFFKGLKGVPVLGKAAVAAGVLATAIGVTGDAVAATVTPDATETNASTTVKKEEIGTIHAIGAEVMALGASTAGALAARGTASAVAPILAQLGARSLPVWSSVLAAGEAIYDTTGHTMRGEFGKAGLRAVAGIGETVAGIGGAATYLTLGTAWREAVVGVGGAMFGKENTIEHSYVIQGAGLLKSAFGGAHDNKTAAATPEDRKLVAAANFAPAMPA